MGKNTATSWLSIVKKAFRSPAIDKEKKIAEEEKNVDRRRKKKRREKRKWLFRRPSNINHVQQCEAKTPTNHAIEEQRHAIAVAAATTAVEIVRLSSRPSNHVNIREHYIYAAVVIQTAFRGYLARRALRALKGLVKLQALVRGHNVIRQAKLALKCMQSLVKSRDMSCTTDEWDDRAETSEDIEALFQNKKETALKREKALAYAFSNQTCGGRRPHGSPKFHTLKYFHLPYAEAVGHTKA